MLNQNYSLYKALLKEKQFVNTKRKYQVYFSHQETDMSTVAEKKGIEKPADVTKSESSMTELKTNLRS